jgi:hypothetical protein
MIWYPLKPQRNSASSWKRSIFLRYHRKNRFTFQLNFKSAPLNFNIESFESPLVRLNYTNESINAIDFTTKGYESPDPSQTLHIDEQLPSVSREIDEALKALEQENTSVVWSSEVEDSLKSLFGLQEEESTETKKQLPIAINLDQVVEQLQGGGSELPELSDELGVLNNMESDGESTDASAAAKAVQDEKEVSFGFSEPSLSRLVISSNFQIVDDPVDQFQKKTVTSRESEPYKPLKSETQEPEDFVPDYEEDT